MADGPSRIVKRPTGSGGEPSSPNCESSAGVKARHPFSRKLLAINDLGLDRDGDWRFCVTFCVTFIPSQPMPTPTGLFERNGHYYLRLIIPASVGHKARMCPAYALGDGLDYALEKPFAKYFLAAN